MLKDKNRLLPFILSSAWSRDLLKDEWFFPKCRILDGLGAGNDDNGIDDV